MKSLLMTPKRCRDDKQSKINILDYVPGFITGPGYRSGERHQQHLNIAMPVAAGIIRLRRMGKAES